MPPSHVLAELDQEYAQAHAALDSVLGKVQDNLNSLDGPAPLPSELYGATAYQLKASSISYGQLVALASVAMARILTDTTEES
jgi:hypothetical protein